MSLFRNPYRTQAGRPNPPKPIANERTNLMDEDVTSFEMAFFRANTCPDCEHKGFLEGPHGGSCVNFKCAGSDCGSRFNDMGPFGIQRISDASPDRKVQ